MIEMTFRPMPTSPSWRSTGRTSIRPTHKKAMMAIRRELSAIGATHVVIEAGFRPDQIRDDGYPYSNERPSHPTIRISFRREGSHPMCMTSGGYADWHYNVYLIALTLEALRAVDRYGCTQGGEQYEGWSQLPPAAEPPPRKASEWKSVTAAWLWMGELCGKPLGTPLDVLYRECAKIAHPDRGGTNELMAKVTRARDFIDAEGDR